MASGEHEALLGAPPRRDGAAVERRFGVAGVLAALGLEPEVVHCGRYRLQRKLGEGAMGQVFGAHDPELDREVALKMLRPEVEVGGASRLRAEARTLAQLSHPHVVQVLAVGEEDGRTWIVMELVRGQTLAEWSARHPPGSRRRFRTAWQYLRAAARGLGAAHCAGLVHRDFKPANVLVGDDGAVKVADFGLATADVVTTVSSAGREQNFATGSGDSAFDRTGAFVGTPRYMSPEQHAATRADARSDQFGFAASAWEVLYGVPPFPQDNLVELCDAKLEASIAAPPAVGVPGWVEAPLRRALRARAEERHASMDDLLAALRPPRWRLPAALTAGVAAAGGLVLVTATGPERHPCASLQAPQWDARRDDVHAVVEADGGPERIEAWQRVETTLDAYVHDWTQQRDRRCSALPEHEPPPVCLSDAARRVDDVVDLLVAGEGDVGVYAVAMADDLPDIDCDVAAQEGPRGPDRDAIEAALSKAAALSAAGRHTDEHALLLPLEAKARSLGDDAVLAKVLGELGDLDLEVGDPPQGAKRLEESYFLRAGAGDDKGALKAALSLFAWALGNGADPKPATQWIEHAEAAVTRLGAPRDRSAMAVMVTRAHLEARVHGDYERTRQLCAEAAEIGRELDPPVPTALASAERCLADAAMARGDVDAAVPHVREFVAQTRAGFGAIHPRTQMAHQDLSAILFEQGSYSEAVAEQRIAVAGAEAAYGKDAPRLITFLDNLALGERRIGDLEDAERTIRRALAIAEATSAAPDIVGGLVQNLALTLEKRGDIAGARRHFERALALLEAHHGADHPELAYALHGYANLLLGAGDLEGARRGFERSLNVLEKAHGADAPTLVFPLGGLGQTQLQQGETAAARGTLERALALLVEGSNPEMHAHVRWTLAQALDPADAGERAPRLAREARAGYAALDADDEVTKIDVWLATRPD
jgi:serine/threonine protein kinase/tetratricopeptide (TPR) repeat protein